MPEVVITVLHHYAIGVLVNYVAHTPYMFVTVYGIAHGEKPHAHQSRMSWLTHVTSLPRHYDATCTVTFTYATVSNGR